MYTDYKIAFDGANWLNYDNDFAQNVVIFGADNSSSTHAENRINNFLLLGERSIYDVNERFGAPEKKFSINFNKAKTKFCLILHYNGVNSYFLVNGKEIYKFKADNGAINFPT